MIKLKYELMAVIQLLLQSDTILPTILFSMVSFILLIYLISFNKTWNILLPYYYISVVFIFISSQHIITMSYLYSLFRSNRHFKPLLVVYWKLRIAPFTFFGIYICSISSCDKNCSIYLLTSPQYIYICLSTPYIFLTRDEGFRWQIM